MPWSGGGFIGMLAAEALRKLRMQLTIVDMADQLMPQLLDETGGKLFARAVTDSGVDLRLGSQVESVSAANDGGVAVRVKGGDEIATDLLVVAAGVRPCLGAVSNESVRASLGIVVDKHMRSSAPDVYAAGDVAEVQDFVSGEPVVHAIWPTAVDQGRAAGVNMAGRVLYYPGSLGMNVVGLFGVTLAELGRFRETPGDSIEVTGGSEGARYRKIVVDGNGTMVGGMYLGEEGGVAEMGIIHHAIKRRETWKDFVSHGGSASYATLFARAPLPWGAVP